MPSTSVNHMDPYYIGGFCFFSGTPNSSNSWTVYIESHGDLGIPHKFHHFFPSPRFTSSQWPIPKPSTKDENGLPQQRGRMAISAAGLRPHHLRGRRLKGFTDFPEISQKTDGLGGERNWKNHHRNMQLWLILYGITMELYDYIWWLYGYG